MSADYEIKRTDGSTETVRAHNYMQAIYLAGGLKEGSNIAGVERQPPKKKLSRRDEIVAQARREELNRCIAIAQKHSDMIDRYEPDSATSEIEDIITEMKQDA